MKTMELRTTEGTCIARNVRLACSFPARYVGLLRRSRMSAQDGLLLVPGGSIHTIGMRYRIDVVFLSRQMRVLGLAQSVPPWRFRVAPKGTARVLELAAGQISATGLKPGMFIVVDDIQTAPPIDVGHSSQPPSWRRAACERLPIQFSLRLPLQRRCMLPARMRCSTRRESNEPKGARQ